MFKPGQLIGMGNTDISLLVEVQRSGHHTMECYVVNGCWSFSYNFATATMSFNAPSGPGTSTAHILYTGSYPPNLREYNEVIDYMNTQLALPWYARVITRVKYTAISWGHHIIELPARIKNALAGARKGWLESPQSKPPASDWDDDIPF